MSWTNQQEAAIKDVRRWLKNKRGPQVFRLFGYAGSGKTTLAKELASSVRGTVVYACFTGKAALVLQGKGCDGACTIHSLIYKAIQDETTGAVHFKLNPDSAAATADLIVIDEVSMVGEELAQDLLSFGTKVLVLGDPAQLPPVKGEGFFINAKPDVMLTEIHRQAADNPIIRMSMDVREGRGLQYGAYGDSSVLNRSRIDKEGMRELVMGADQLLCGLNRTRQAFNNRIRELKGIAGVHSKTGRIDTAPVVGDRLVCLRNNQEKGLLNGGLWDVREAGHLTDTTIMRVKSLDDPKLSPVDVQVPNEFWTGTEKTLDWRVLKEFDQFTYGYALTVHKSQGSSWPNVLVFDESSIFRQDAAKHLYTAITRSSEKVTVVI